jgi:ATP-dependent Lon protease
MARTQTATLPLTALPKGSVLLPGVIQPIRVSPNRPDFTSLLAAVSSRAASKTANGRIDAVPIACVPLASPFLGPNGQRFLKNGEQVDDEDRPDINPARLTKADLFTWGVAAKIRGVQGRGTGEFALLVEGIARIRVEKIYQERAHLEAKITHFHDDGMHLSDRLASPSEREG